MSHTVGRPRIYTDAQVAAVRAWKPDGRRSFTRLCIELGISSTDVGRGLRRKQYKKPSP